MAPPPVGLQRCKKKNSDLTAGPICPPTSMSLGFLSSRASMVSPSSAGESLRFPSPSRPTPNANGLGDNKFQSSGDHELYLLTNSSSDPVTQRPHSRSQFTIMPCTRSHGAKPSIQSRNYYSYSAITRCTRAGPRPGRPICLPSTAWVTESACLCPSHGAAQGL
ncbi:hypothetical protein BDV10DRAFT_100689 [Aspergillus recurvatus]